MSRTGEVAQPTTPDPTTPPTTDLDRELRDLARAVRAVTSLPTGGLDVAVAARTHDDLRALCDRLRAYGARLLAQVEADGRWAASGSARTFPQWQARRGGASVGTARREAVLGRALNHDLPATREAVADGQMSLEHAQVLAQYAPTSDARRAALAGDKTDRNEAFLVMAATRVGVDEYRHVVRRWAAAVDTLTHETEHDSAIAKEFLFVTPKPGGVTIQGFLAGEHAETLTTALRAVGGVPSADDPRSPEQRRAHALTDLAQVVLNRGLGGAGAALVRPHISVHVPWDTFTRLAHDSADATAPTRLEGPDGALGAATELDDGTPIPISVLARITCDAEITRIVFGPDNAPLDVGRTQRTYTGPQRRAVIARDRHCQYPGCTAPPTLGEIHHIRWWSHQGPTSVDNGILMCAFHHHTIHKRGITITRQPGSWEFRDRDGRTITPPVRRAGPQADRPPGRRAPPPAESPGRDESHPARPPLRNHDSGAARTGGGRRTATPVRVVQNQLALTG